MHPTIAPTDSQIPALRAMVCIHAARIVRVTALQWGVCVAQPMAVHPVQQTSVLQHVPQSNVRMAA